MPSIRSFSCISGINPKALILGTMPGKASLEKNQYYAFKHNQFWKLVYEAFGKIPDTDYRRKIRFIKDRNIALWDVLRACRRDNTSADSAIRNEKPNDITALLGRYPGITHIFFNGREAQKFFRRHFGRHKLIQKIILLPSSSPANASSNYAQKLTRWRKIFKVVNNTPISKIKY